MKVLILGASGMLGHKMMQRLDERFEVWGSVRGDAEKARRFKALASARLMGGVSATDLKSVAKALEQVQPQVVINCIGIVKQLEQAYDPVACISINSLFPHQLAGLCAPNGIRLLQISTDCVFSGNQGPYLENDNPDPTDLYGRSKLLGELDEPGCLTIRTSIIGRQLQHGKSLIEWFLSEKGGIVRGYANALYTGFTTLALSDVVADIIENYPRLEGIWHVSSQAISKYDLLTIVNGIYDLKITVQKDESFHCDRRLDSSRFRQATGFSSPSWDDMISQMHADPTPYNGV